MLTEPTTPVGWYLWQIKATHLLPASILAAAVLARNLLVGVMTPIYVARLITNFDSPELNHRALQLIAVVVLAGITEVINLGMKQVINYGVRRALIETLANISKTYYLPWVRFSGSIPAAVDDFFSSWRDIMSAIFTQLPTLAMGFGGLIVVAFIHGMVLMGCVAIVLAIAAPVVMYITTKKVRPGVKRASAAERSEREILGAIFENFDMSLLEPVLEERMQEYGDKAKRERYQTSWLVRRRTAEVQLINITLVSSAVLMAVSYFHASQNATSSALIITIVLVLTGNLTLIHNMLDSFHDAQSRASGLTDVLKKRKLKPPMPPALAKKDGIYIKNLRVTFTIKHEGAVQEKIVEFPPMAIVKRGLICFNAESGRGKSTFFNILTGCLDDYTGSVQLGGHEVGAFRCTRVAQVKQELKKVDIPVLYLFGLQKEPASSSDWELCHQILEWVGFSNVLLTQNLNTLSGGERRRILTAYGLFWAMKLRLDVILLDEPTNDLDVKHVEILCEGLRAFAAVSNMYVGVASHNPMLQKAADQIIPW